jgi:hypothetical protein
MLFVMLNTVLEGLPGGGVTEHQTQQRAGEVPTFMSSKVLPVEVLKLRKEGNRDSQQEETTKDDDVTIPYHLWYSRLTILWAGNGLIKPHTSGMPQAVEVLQQRFCLRYWEIKVRTSFFQWFKER